jgi:hypothetical protein
MIVAISATIGRRPQLQKADQLRFRVQQLTFAGTRTAKAPESRLNLRTRVYRHHHSYQTPMIGMITDVPGRWFADDEGRA